MINSITPADIHFKAVGNPLPDWRAAVDDEDQDDEELTETPLDVVAVLGFDPLDLGEEE